MIYFCQFVLTYMEYFTAMSFILNFLHTNKKHSKYVWYVVLCCKLFNKHNETQKYEKNHFCVILVVIFIEKPLFCGFSGLIWFR